MNDTRPTMPQAEDFRHESRVLAELLAPLAEDDYNIPTLFKGWTINDVLGHLHMFNVAAVLTLNDIAAFQVLFGRIARELAAGRSMLETQFSFLDGLHGRALFDAWLAAAERTADLYGQADPKARVKWAGPDMSTLSAITARQMETWAHGQEVFDRLGAVRLESDRIRNIVHLGVNTYGWSFLNRGLPVPEPAPQLSLTAPSGTIWQWNTEQADNAISGLAVEFAQVVTQVRHIDDTALVTSGPTARRWMEIAQCFAGKPEDPPARGSRHIATPSPRGR